MSGTENRIKNLGIVLPSHDRRGTGVVDAVLCGDMLYVSAQLPYDENGNMKYAGKVGTDLTLEDGYAAARLCGMNALSVIKDYIGDLDRVEYIVKLLGLVNSGADFSSQPAVINGFSDLMVEVFGRRGQHARSAMGTYSLPQNAAVSVEIIVKVRR